MFLFSHCIMSDSFATPWIVACQAPLSMEFSRQEYWSGLPCSPPGSLPNPGIEPMYSMSPALQADSLPTEPPAICFKEFQKTVTFIFVSHSSVCAQC